MSTALIPAASVEVIDESSLSMSDADDRAAASEASGRHHIIDVDDEPTPQTVGSIAAPVKPHKSSGLRAAATPSSWDRERCEAFLHSATLLQSTSIGDYFWAGLSGSEVTAEDTSALLASSPAPPASTAPMMEGLGGVCLDPTKTFLYTCEQRRRAWAVLDDDDHAEVESTAGGSDSAPSGKGEEDGEQACSFRTALRRALEKCYTLEDNLTHAERAAEDCQLGNCEETEAQKPSYPAHKVSPAAPSEAVISDVFGEGGVVAKALKQVQASISAPNAYDGIPTSTLGLPRRVTLSRQQEVSACRAPDTPSFPAYQRELLLQGYRKHLQQLRSADRRKVRENREAADQSTDMHRHRELPFVVEDAVRYAGLLVQLRDAFADSAPASTSVGNGSVTAAVGNVKFGDPSLLLYGRYPPPLFRTTSFATETIRLLKWLRTWRVPEETTGASVGDGKRVPQPKSTAGTSVVTAVAVAGAPVLGAVKASPPPPLQQRRQESAEDDERESKESKKTASQRAFLAFFGAAAKVKSAEREAPATQPVSGRKRRADEEDAGPQPPSVPAAGQRRAVQRVEKEVTPTVASTATEDEEQEVFPRPLPRSAYTEAVSTFSRQWLDTLHTTSSSLTASAERRSTTSAVAAGPEHERVAPVARVCSSLPFFKEMQEEGDLLHTTGSTYYYDAHGNRLRSARLAKMEAERRSHAEAQERRKERVKGYFSRSATAGAASDSWSSAWTQGRSAAHMERGLGRDDDSDGSGSSSGSCSSALTGDDGGGEDITNIAVICGPTGVGKTASVYLAAHLLGFRVVELNASVRRCPRTVERVLAELTRSHRLSGQGRSTVSIEGELHKLKQEHAIALAKIAAEEAAEAKRRDAKRKANAISAEAVVNFFKPKVATTSAAAAELKAKTREPAEKAAEAVDVETSTATAVPAEGSEEVSQGNGATASSTLLLIEDADIFLCDEALRPFYASIRDLAHKSKIPIVVIVSAEALDTARYGDAPTLTSTEQQQQQRGALWRGGCPADLCLSTTQAEEELRLFTDPMTAAVAAVSVEQGTTFTHVAFTPALSEHYFGQQTPFARIEPLSQPALFAQLLVVGAVELGIVRPAGCQARSSSVVGGCGGNPSDAIVSSSHVLYSMSVGAEGRSECSRGGQAAPYTEEGLILTDAGAFESLAQTLRRSVFGGDVVEGGEEGPSRSWAKLRTSLTQKAARLRTTDVRWWLNELQYHLLAAPRPAWNPDSSCSSCYSRGTREVGAQEPAASIITTTSPLCASSWDVARGRYRSSVAFNDAQCPRQQQWLLERAVSYTQDIVEELDTLDHPTRHINYSRPPPQPAAAGAKKGRGRPRAAKSRREEEDEATLKGNGVMRGLAQITSTLPTSTGTSDGSASGIFGLAARRPEASASVSGPATVPYTQRDLQSGCPLRPVSVILPYSCAQRLVCDDRLLLPHHGPDAALLAPTPLPTSISAAIYGVTPQGAARVCDDVVVHMHQSFTSADRVGYFKQAWKRPRRAEVSKALVAGRGTGAYEDAVGFTCLMVASSVVGVTAADAV